MSGYKDRAYKNEAPDGFLAPTVKLNPAAYSVHEIKARAADDEAKRWTPDALEARKKARRLGYLKKMKRLHDERKLGRFNT